MLSYRNLNMANWGLNLFRCKNVSLSQLNLQSCCESCCEYKQITWRIRGTVVWKVIPIGWGGGGWGEKTDGILDNRNKKYLMKDLAQDTFIAYSFSYIRRQVGLLQHITKTFSFTWSNISFMYSIFNVLYIINYLCLFFYTILLLR